jgi:L-cysteine S-thiosulfotransferase
MRLQPLRTVILALALAVAACSNGGDAAPKGAARLSGAAIFNQRCRDCHRVDGDGGVTGPDLTKVGARRDRVFLDCMVRNPSKLFPGATMPPYESLPAEELRLLVDYLLTLK